MPPRVVAAGPGMLQAIHTALGQTAAAQVLSIAFASFLEGRSLPADTPISIQVTGADIAIGEIPGGRQPQAEIPTPSADTSPPA